MLFHVNIPTVSVLKSTLKFPVHRIYCVGRNYVEHAQEMGHSGKEAPFFFLKPNDTILHNESASSVEMAYPTLTKNLHYECELVVALGKGGKDISVEKARELVYGYAVGLDMTRRDLQNECKSKGRPWSIGKGFEQSAPIGCITPA